MVPDINRSGATSAPYDMTGLYCTVRVGFGSGTVRVASDNERHEGTGLAGEDSNLQHTAPKAVVLPLNYPPPGRTSNACTNSVAQIGPWRGALKVVPAAKATGLLEKSSCHATHDSPL